jgi:hypothetical protein
MTMPNLPDLITPWWMDGTTLADSTQPQEPAMLVQGTQSFWQKITDWLTWPLSQQSALTCSEDVLGLLAWENSVVRFSNEPLWLYRRRVHFAYLNTLDAGSMAGFKRILSRFDIDVLATYERQAGRDWDIVSIELADNALVTSDVLLATLIQDFGRTCRRYEHTTTNTAAIEISAAEYHCNYDTEVAQ